MFDLRDTDEVLYKLNFAEILSEAAHFIGLICATETNIAIIAKLFVPRLLAMTL